ncbi:hypothetical protein I7I50_08351 [Histoplasma capsulatum G186AR]|uniref:Uncharacterized protein n=1 Tax=Ajellomyces capsulatus TaxID=5037 RepID=A0A8H8CZK2_AJECA|nr:hypothetical protein I7I52_05867 [Histoplasma capsulatum]QSS73545.1 hypothetical protein I7I50_08351 [Histoplasma capsulatum G186AR]
MDALLYHLWFAICKELDEQRHPSPRLNLGSLKLFFFPLPVPWQACSGKGSNRLSARTKERKAQIGQSNLKQTPPSSLPGFGFGFVDSSLLNHASQGSPPVR